MNVPLEHTPPSNDLPEASTPHLSTLAVWSFFLGLASLLLLVLTGIPALLLGYRGLYAINASEGRLRGRPFARAGMVLGSVGCLLAVGYVVLLLFNSLWNTSHRATCENNLRLLGFALESYQQTHQHTYPSATVPNRKLKPDERLSWLAAVMPYLNNKPTKKGKTKWQSLAETIDYNQGWEAPANQAARLTTVNTFLCPGHLAQERSAAVGLTDYVGLAGVGVDAANLPRNDPRAGFFGYDRVVTLDQVKDRRSYLLIVTETTFENGPWIAGGQATVRGVPDTRPLFGAGAPFGGCHRQGFNTLWLDGSVRFQSLGMSVELFTTVVRINREAEAPPAGDP